MQKTYKINGFAIISAVFILVVLSLVASFLINIFINTKASSDIFLQGQRAHWAAKSGLEWGLTTVAASPAGPCPATNTINLTQTGLFGFTVVVSCTKVGSTFTITSVASKGVFGAFGYVTKTVTGTYG